MSSSQDSQAHHSPDPASDRLDSWKEVAAYLKRDVRTVQRWEKRHGLPVHRLMNSERGPIYAFKSEIDVWWREHSAQIEAQVEVPGNGAELPAEAAEPAKAAGLRLMHVAIFSLAIIAAGTAIFFVSAWNRNGSRGSLEGRAQPVRILRVLAHATSEGRSPIKIPVGAQPEQVVISPDDATLYVRNQAGKSISVVSAVESRVIDTISIGFELLSMAISPDGKRLYAGTASDGLFEIDTESRKVSPVKHTQPEVRSLAMAPDGRFLYMAMVNDGLAKLNTATGEVIKISAPACPFAIAISKDGRYLYINYQCGGPNGSSGHDAIEVMDTATDEPTKMENSGKIPNVGIDIEVTPDGKYVWAAGGGCGRELKDHTGCAAKDVINFHVFRASDRSYMKPLGFTRNEGFNGVSFVPGSTRAVMGGGTFGLVDTGAYSVVEHVNLKASPKVAFSRDGTKMYVALPEENSLAVFSTMLDSCGPEVPPQAWWPGDGTAADIGGQDVGKLQRGAGYAPGKIGQAFALDGKAGHVTLSNPRSVFGSTFTVAMWIKPSGEPASGPAGETASREVSILHRMGSPGANVNGWRVFVNCSGRVTFCIGGKAGDGCSRPDGVRVEADELLPTERWSHIVAVRRDERIWLYINGELQGAPATESAAVVAVPPTRDVTPPEIQLGAALGRARAFRGLIDEIQVFARVLSDQEIRQLHAWDACLK